MTNKISGISRLLLAITSILLVISIFVPLWRIELDAPQYPEGLMMQIFANKLGGQVDIINGLNHYIGMQTLHAENFIEFTLLPYIIGFFALLILIAAIVGKKKVLYFSFWAFVLFGIIAMADFWRWEYNYGHNLDQPPLIGFKQLLNFGAYSIPDIGGWLFVASGLIMLFAVLMETKILSKIFKKKVAKNIAALLFCSILFISCNNNEAQPIKLNTDKCDFCEMTISNGRLGAEIITKKGRAYKFDDINCFKAYIRGNVKVTIASFFINDYTKSNVLIDATKAFYVTSESIKSPMGGNTAAFKTKDVALDFANKNNSIVKTWEEINQ
jgi:copper chaperone NosL